MKKFFAFAAFAALTVAGMTSCSNDDELAQTQPVKSGVINLGVNLDGRVGTRGTAADLSYLQNTYGNFMVFGYFSPTATGTAGSGVTAGGRYVGSSDTEGTVVSFADGAWSYAVPQYWPATSAPLNFQAVAPASDASFSIINTVDAANKLACVAADITIPTAVASQKDILFAKADNQTSDNDPVNLTFKHGLSQVVFFGKVAADNITAEVSEISVCEVNQRGTVGFIGSNSALGSKLPDTKVFNNFSAGLVDDTEMTTTTAKNLTATDGALMMLPQVVSPWTTTAATAVPLDNAKANHNAYLKVKCTVASNGVNIFNDEYVYIPFDLNWEQGKKYTYTLVFGADGGGFSEDGTQKTVKTITYTVQEVEEWTAADGGEYEF